MAGLLEGQVLQVVSILFSATEARSATAEAVLLVLSHVTDPHPERRRSIPASLSPLQI